MNKAAAAFDAAVTAVLDAVTAASVAEILSHDLAAALADADRMPPPDLEVIVRSALCADLEPHLDPARSRDRLADIVASLEPQTPPDPFSVSVHRK